MENIDITLEAIRAGVAAEAAAEARAAAADACRTLLAALDPPLPSPAVVPQEQPAIDPNIAALASAIRGVPMDQLLDLAIAKLKTMVPAVAASSPAHRLSIPLIPVARR